MLWIYKVIKLIVIIKKSYSGYDRNVKIIMLCGAVCHKCYRDTPSCLDKYPYEYTLTNKCRKIYGVIM